MKWKLVGCVLLLACLLLQAAPVMAGGGSTEVTGAVPLVTSNVTATNISYYSATISWKTNDNATSQVFYDTVSHTNIADYTANITDNATVTLHSISLTGLSSATTYHYKVRSAIPGTEFIAISDNYTFTTLTPPEGGGIGGAPSGPVVVSPGVVDVTRVVTAEGVFTQSVTTISADNKVQLSINQGVTGKTEEGTPLSQISVTPMTTPPAPPAQSNAIGITYDLGPDGATFSTSITITFTYDPTQIPAGVNEKDLVIAYYDKTTSTWVPLEGITIDPANHIISGKIGHFTPFTIIAKAPVPLPSPPPVPTPAAFSVSNLTVQPAEVQPKAAATISVLVANTGGTEGSHTVVLKINGVVEATKEVTVNAGLSKEVIFTTSKDIAGTYLVEVDGLSGSFIVKEKPVIPVIPPVIPKPVNWWLIGGIIAGIMVVVGLVIFFLMRRRAA